MANPARPRHRPVSTLFYLPDGRTALGWRAAAAAMGLSMSGLEQRLAGWERGGWVVRPAAPRARGFVLPDGRRVRRAEDACAALGIGRTRLYQRVVAVEDGWRVVRDRHRVGRKPEEPRP